MSLYTPLISGIVFPLQERLKHHTTLPVRKKMEQSQYWPLEKLESLRISRLKTLLANAGQHVPYYRNLFAQIGFDPTAISATADLQRLPFLDKAVIRANTEDLKSDQAKDLARADSRKSQVGSGDRSERIRTSTFPHGRVTDHRIGLTLHSLPQGLEGDIDPLLDARIAEDQAARLADLEAEFG